MTKELLTLTQRLSISFAVLLAVLAGVLNVTMNSWLPIAAREAFVEINRSKPSPEIGILAISATYWAALAMGIFGLWQKKSWGLWASFAATVASTFLAALLGPHAYSGGAYAISYLSKVLWGIGLGTSLQLVATSHKDTHSLD